MVDVTWRVLKKRVQKKYQDSILRTFRRSHVPAFFRRSRVVSFHYANSGFDLRTAKGGFVVEQQRDGRSETESTSERWDENSNREASGRGGYSTPGEEN